MLSPEFPAQLLNTVSNATASVLWKVLRYHQTQHMRPYAGAKSLYGMLNMRTGELARSFRVDLSTNKSKAEVTGTYGTKMRRAEILERGGRIFGNPWLTVPIRDGLPSAQSMRAAGGTFIKRAKSGKLIIWRRRGAEHPEPVYVLKPSVFINERRTVQKTKDGIKQNAAREIATSVRMLIARGY